MAKCFNCGEDANVCNQFCLYDKCPHCDKKECKGSCPDAMAAVVKLKNDTAFKVKPGPVEQDCGCVYSEKTDRYYRICSTHRLNRR